MQKLTYVLACALLAFTSLAIQAQQPQEYTEIQKRFVKQKTDEPLVIPKLARQDEFKSGFLKPFGKAFLFSSAGYWIGTIADITSSRGQGFYEGNPRFRNGSGGLATGKNLAVSGGIYAVTVILEKRWPMPMAVLRSIVGIGRLGVGLTNKHY